MLIHDLRRGDENISSKEVERVVNSHPQVAESAVIAVPDLIHGEEVKAYILFLENQIAITLVANHQMTIVGQFLHQAFDHMAAQHVVKGRAA